MSACRIEETDLPGYYYCTEHQKFLADPNGCETEPEPPNWEGYSNPDHHHTTGRRAWNYNCGEWCYPSDWCEECKRHEYGDPWEQLERVREVIAQYDEYLALTQHPEQVVMPTQMLIDQFRKALEGDSNE